MKRFVTTLSDGIVNRAFIFVGIIFIFTALPSLALGQLIWNTDQLIGDNVGTAWPPRVAMSGENVVVIWQGYDGSNLRIYASHSTDGGSTWSYGQLIEDNAGYDARYPEVAMSGDNVVAVWHQEDDDGKYRVYANCSTNGGVTWGSDQLIENNVGYHAGLASLAMSENNVVVVWYQSDGSNDRIYANHSTDGGVTWGSDQLIEDNAGYDSRYPRVAMSENNVVAVWQGSDGSNDRIYANHSADGGVTWGSDQLIEDNAGYDAGAASVAVSGDSVVAVWDQDDGSDYSIYSNHSSDGGANWGSDRLIEDNTGASSGYKAIAPKVAISGNSVVAVWLERHVEGGGNHTYANYSTDGGATWGSDQFIAELMTIEIEPADMALSGNFAVIGWYQFDSVNFSHRIYAYHSTDGGATWSSGQLIEDNVGSDCHPPQVTISGNMVVAVWFQDDESGNLGLYANLGRFSNYEEKIEEIQDFFDTVVLSGGLVGIGPTAVSAEGKLNALRNMLDEAEYLITNGYIAEACQQLSAIYIKTDGMAPPPDFVEGVEAPALAEMILSLMNDLGCE